MKKRSVALLLAAAICATAFAGCKPQEGTSQVSQGSSQEASTTSEVAEDDGMTNEDRAFMKFDEPVEVHVGQSVNPLDTTLPEGDSVDNNQYTRYLLDNFNIKVVADWTAAQGNDFTQKVALCIASNSLPDAVVTGRQYMLQAAKSDMLYDMTELFDLYCSPQAKGIMDSTEGRAYEDATYDGKMVALLGIEVECGGISNLNIRKDWLDELGLEVPTTLDEIEEVAKVFLEKKPAGDETIAILGPSKSMGPYNTFQGSAGTPYGFDPVFSAYDVYPGYWLEDEEGTVTYGSTDEKMKDALGRLASWYEQGLIDPEMGTRDTPAEMINAGKVGMFFGPWWIVGYGIGDAYRNEPDANWQSYPVYTDDGQWNTKMMSTTTSYTIVNKKVSEDVVKAIIIMRNVWLRDESKFDVSVAPDWYPIRNLQAPADECEYTYEQLIKVLNGEADPEDYNDPNSSYKLLYDDVSMVKDVVTGYTPGEELSIEDFNTENFGDFQRMYSLLVGDRPYRYHLGPNVQIGNIYPKCYAQTFYEGMEAQGQKNIVNLLRCAWAGSQKYGALVWSGDIHSSFESLRNQFAAGLNMGMAGIPWWTTDIGGFHGGDPSDPAFREVLVRWFQYGAFCPVMRLHGDRMPHQKPLGTERGGRCPSGGDNEVWSFGEEAYEICKKYLFLRERMRPYTEKAMAQAHEKGTPVMRPLFYGYPQDSQTWEVEDQYLYGDHILVAPVMYTGQTSRQVYLPEGAVWTNVWTREEFLGGQTILVDAPLDRIPLFVSDATLAELLDPR